MEQTQPEPSHDGYLRAVAITLQGGPAGNHKFFAFPGLITSIFTVGMTYDQSKHFYAYDAQSNKATYLGPQNNNSLDHPVIAWVDTTPKETE